jgi:tetratricopeptide (TPR) repeat protein
MSIRKISASSPDYSVAYRNRGLSFNALRQYDKAISDYDEAIRLNLGYSAAFNSRGSSY